MKKHELAKKTRQELMDMARKIDLAGRSRMKKEELIVSLVKSLGKKEFETSRKSPLASGKQVKKKMITRKKKEELASVAVRAEKPGYWQEKVEDAKFYLGAEEKGLVTAEELPASYGDNKIVLMVRDPHWAYVYWELNKQKVDEAKKKLQPVFDQTRLILRVYDITNIDFDGINAHSFFDIEIPDVLGNWYVNLGRPNRSFCIDIGYRKPDGGIFTISRSNRIATPRDTFSEVMDEEWATLEESEAIYCWSAGLRPGSSVELAERIKKGLEKGISSASIKGLGSEKILRNH